MQTAILTVSSHIINTHSLKLVVPSFKQILHDSLIKTKRRLNFNSFFAQKKIDEDSLNALEDQFLSADVGIDTTDYIIKQLRMLKTEDPIKAISTVMLSMFNHTSNNEKTHPLPHVIVMAGVNGAGKTTTIGKLAKKFSASEKKILLASGDTFRAAAHEQLSNWGSQSNVDVFIDKNTTDPAAIAYTALEMAKARNYDILIIDTAGRQYNQKHLMNELEKIIRTLNKVDALIEPDIWMVIDAGSGQNGVKQIASFKDIVPITGVIASKLDGTAKGGALLSIAHTLDLPIIYLGVGEKIDDLQLFNAEEFISALLEEHPNG